MTKVQMAPGIPNEKSRTVRPIHGPATIHLPLQVYALPCREASVLSLQYASGFPASVPDILGLPIARAQFDTPSSIFCIKKHVETVSSNVRILLANPQVPKLVCSTCLL
jgi:hypothetical protein